MKNRPAFYLLLLGAALAGLLALQLAWLWKAANLREALFEEKVRRVLQETATAVGPMVEWKDGNLSMAPLAVRQVDSLFKLNLARYGIDLPYAFRVDQMKADDLTTVLPLKQNPETFATCLPGGVLLELQFPELSRFLWEEMGFQFALSLLLISILLGVSWQGIRHFQKEQAVLEQATVFLHNMTHEWKTPIATIRLAIRRLRDAESKGQTERLQRYAGMVEAENERLARQVNWVLDMQGIRQASWQPVSESLELAGFLKVVLDDFTLLAEEKEMQLVPELPNSPLMIQTDAWALGVVLRNLLDNAIRYAPRATKVWLSCTRSDSALLVRVRDEGPGIPMAYRERIFEAYFRIPQGDRHEVKGFGLGLSYARTLAEKLGLGLLLEESSGKGSTFLIRLPHAG